MLPFATPAPTPTVTPTPTPSDADVAEALNKLVAVLGERLAPNLLTDLIAPLATIVLAVAAVVVAFFSWRTATKANELTERYRAEDRAYREGRFRRGIAVEMREWARAGFWRAREGVYYERNDPEGKQIWKRRAKIRAKLEREGEADGMRLMSRIHGRLVEVNGEEQVLTPKQFAQARHPSRVFQGLRELESLVNSWAKDPSSIETELKTFEDGEAAKARERAKKVSGSVRAQARVSGDVSLGASPGDD